jgi:hypothetical protein
MRKIAVLFGLGVLACLPASAWASITFEYVTDQSNYNVVAGQSVTVNVYLQEILTGTSTSLIKMDGGMLSAGVAADRAGTQTAASLTAISENTGTPWPSGSFKFGADNFTATHAQIGVNSNGQLGTANNVFPDANGKILIGTMTVTVATGSATGVVTQFNLSGYPSNGQGGNTVTIGASAASKAAASAYDLDFTNNQSPSTGGLPAGTYTGTGDATVTPLEHFTVTVAAVPEPSSLLLCGLVACGGIYGGYRRRKAQKAEAAPAV